MFPTGLAASQISIGWGLASELMDPSLDRWAFREVVKRHYYPDAAMHQQGWYYHELLAIFERRLPDSRNLPEFRRIVRGLF